MDSLTLTIPVGDKSMAVQTAWPQAEGPFAAIVVIMHAGGVDTFVHAMLTRLVEASYFVAAPDLYHRLDSRQGDGLDRMRHLRDPEVQLDVNATVEFLRDHPRVDSARLGIIGFCMGGRVAYLMAACNPHFRAVVAYYGGNIMVPWGDGPSPFSLSENLHCPLLFHFGADDTNPSPEDMAKLDNELTRLGKPHEFHTYPNAGHAFLNFVNPQRYREAASQLSWPRTLDFLTRQLG
jgi:carboxymethylenebutenolidase